MPEQPCDIAGALARLRLREVHAGSGRQLYAADDGQRLGVLHLMPGGHPKVTCNLHARCVLWLNLKGSSSSFSEAFVDCYTWVAEGGRMTSAEHQAAARAVKVKHGMRVRS
eukprot:5033466-Alexandrium_andersonii.AAC.1